MLFVLMEKNRLCHIRGRIKKREWACVGDIILIGLRSYQDSKADVLRVYNRDEARRLKKMKEIPNDTKIDTEDRKVEDIPFDFGQNEEGSNDGEEVGEQPPERLYFNYETIMISEEEGEMSGEGEVYEKKPDLNEL